MAQPVFQKCREAELYIGEGGQAEGGDASILPREADGGYTVSIGAIHLEFPCRALYVKDVLGDAGNFGGDDINRHRIDPCQE